MCAAEAYILTVLTTVKEQKSSRFVARVTAEDKRLFQRAAAIEGRSMATFVVTHAREVARRVIHQSNQVQLEAEESRRFVEALLARPRQPTAALKKAMGRYHRRVDEA